MYDVKVKSSSRNISLEYKSAYTCMHNNNIRNDQNDPRRLYRY